MVGTGQAPGSNGGAGGMPGLAAVTRVATQWGKVQLGRKAVHLALHCARLDTFCKGGTLTTELYFHQLEILDAIAFLGTDLYQGRNTTSSQASKTE